MSSSTLGFWPLVALVVGNLVGCGIFLFPATLAPYGMSSFVGWGLTTFGAVIWALMFGRLSILCPTMGGPHVYIQKAWGRRASFFTAWSYWVVAWVSNVALVVATASYAMQGLQEDPWLNLGMQWAILLGCTLVHYKGLVYSGKIEVLLTALKVVCLVVLPLWGFMSYSLQMPPLEPVVPVSVGSAIHQAALLAVWSYIGIETGTVPSGSDSRTVQKALIIGTLIAATIYILGSAIIMGIVPQNELINSQAPYADLAARVWGEWGRSFITVVALVSCIGALSGWVLVVGHMGLSAGREGLFHTIFARVNKEGVPVPSFAIATVCSMVLMVLALFQSLQNQFLFLVDASVNLILVIYAACAASLMRLGNGWQDYTLGVIGLVFSCVVIYASDPWMFVGCLGIVIIGCFFDPHFIKTKKEA